MPRFPVGRSAHAVQCVHRKWTGCPSVTRHRMLPATWAALHPNQHISIAMLSGTPVSGVCRLIAEFKLTIVPNLTFSGVCGRVLFKEELMSQAEMQGDNLQTDAATALLTHPTAACVSRCLLPQLTPIWSSNFCASHVLNILISADGMHD